MGWNKKIPPRRMPKTKSAAPLAPTKHTIPCDNFGVRRLNHGRSHILDAPAQAIPANVPGVVHNQLLCYIQSLRHSLICTRASDMGSVEGGSGPLGSGPGQGQPPWVGYVLWDADAGNSRSKQPTSQTQLLNRP